jgi:hypothetical protein
MKPKYESYEEYVKEYLGFGEGRKPAQMPPILGVELLDRSTNKQQSLYHSFCKTAEEMAKSIAICEAIIDSGNVSGDLRIYVDYNPIYMFNDFLSETAKQYVDYLASNTLSRKVLSAPKSVLLKSRKRKAFLLDVDTQDLSKIQKLDIVLDSLKINTLLVNTTKKGFHYIIEPFDRIAIIRSMSAVDDNANDWLSIKTSDGYLMYER